MKEGDKFGEELKQIAALPTRSEQSKAIRILRAQGLDLVKSERLTVFASGLTNKTFKLGDQGEVHPLTLKRKRPPHL